MSDGAESHPNGCHRTGAPLLNTAAMDPLLFEFVSVEEAKKALDGDLPASTLVDWSELRQPEGPLSLSLTPATLKWLAYLPREVRPLELFHAYPRIANQLAALGNAAAVSTFVGELLIDKRGGRQGFPGGVALELSRLQEYLLQLLQPSAPDVPPAT